MKRIQMRIEGMTCVSCENRITKKLKATQGIMSVKVSYVNGKADIAFDENILSQKSIEKIIEGMDYRVKKAKDESQRVDFIRLAGIAFIIFALYTLMTRFGVFNLFNSFPEAKQGMNYGMLFVIGLLTSVHCVAMCGGINLSQCANHKLISTSTNGFSALRPSFLYNAGRVISYTVVGGIVGAIGSVISFTGAMRGVVQLIAGVFMMIMGLNMLNVLPFLRKLTPHMPKAFAKKADEGAKGKGPLYVGLLNGLMPCGPLQAMQLYALSTGSIFTGAISMLLFSLGTVPLMFGLGALSSLLSKKFTHKMMTASAVLVIAMGIFMLNSGMSLSGVSIAAAPGTASATSSNVPKIENGVQTVTSKVTARAYEPITVQKGIPVKWILHADNGSLNGCNNSIVVPKFNIQKKLQTGDNVIEFTPAQAGVYAFSCWMGMIKSQITVVETGSAGTAGSAAAPNQSAVPKVSLPTDNILVATVQNGVQKATLNLDDKRFSPAVVVVQKGVRLDLLVNVTKSTQGNSTLLFPLYDEQKTVRAGINLVKSFSPVSDIDFFTKDNAIYGYVKVVDDLKKVDLNAIREELKQYTPTPSSEEDASGLPNCCSGSGQ